MLCSHWDEIGWFITQKRGGPQNVPCETILGLRGGGSTP